MPFRYEAMTKRWGQNIKLQPVASSYGITHTHIIFKCNSLTLKHKECMFQGLLRRGASSQ